MIHLNLQMSIMKFIQHSKVILIGASTGGPGIIEKLLTALPKNFTIPICIVQHFPSELTHSFVSRLQTYTSNKVVESFDGLVVEGGIIVVARGGVDLGFRLENHHIVITQGSEVGRHDFIPSVDAMMLSAIEVYEPTFILAVLLSGIGDDGAEGMVKIKTMGGWTVCQDEKSSAVFGMPGRAIDRGGASEVLSVDEIAQRIIGFETV